MTKQEKTELLRVIRNRLDLGLPVFYVPPELTEDINSEALEPPNKGYVPEVH